MQLHSSSAVLLLLLCASVAAEKGKTRRLHGLFSKKKKSNDVSGVDDIEGYTEVAKAYVGLNPIMGVGSGFIIADITADGFGEIPDSGGPRVDMCTCDCKAGADGVGCTGYGGVDFRYSSLLWTEPLSDGKDWTGQMQAFQAADMDLHFMGTDTRIYPGGPVIFNVACTHQDCTELFSGVFRQAHGPVSCLAGIADAADTSDENANGCAARCDSSPTYTDWLAYCNADDEDEDSGFSGYGI